MGSTAYSLAISATSTLGFLSEFSQVELEPPRPGYVLIRGKPLAGHTYYVEATLVGYLESGVQSLTNMQFVSKVRNCLLMSIMYLSVYLSYILEGGGKYI